MEEAEGKIKEAFGALTGDEAKKEEGRSLQRKTKAEKEAAQRKKTRRARAEAREAERKRDKQELKDKGGLVGGMGDALLGDDKLLGR